MPVESFTDSLDRLNETSRALLALASESLPSNGPSFARAVLSAPLDTLIRDIDDGELSLFTPNPAAPSAAPVGTIAHAPPVSRAEFSVATPLRPTRRPVAAAAPAPRVPGPEVYAQAGLKQLNRYQNIRPMPRAQAAFEQIIQQVAEVRQNITKQGASAKAPAEPPSVDYAAMMDEEQRKIKDMQAEIQRLRKRKQTLIAKRSSAPAAPARHSPALVEDSPWKGAQPRSSMGNLLADMSEPDLGALNSSPAPAPPPPPRAPQHRLEPQVQTHVPLLGLLGRRNQGPPPAPSAGSGSSSEDDSELEDETIRVSRPPPLLFARRSTVSEAEAEEPLHTIQEKEEGPKAARSPSPNRAPPPPAKKQRTTPSPGPSSSPAPAPAEASMNGEADDTSDIMITRDIETITTKIRASLGSALSLGSASDTDSILTHLGNLTADASQHSATSARLLLALIRASGHSLPMDALRAAARAPPGAVSRVLYGCVAKRLIRIDRVESEQIVRFNL